MIVQFPPQVSKVYCVIQGVITKIYEFLCRKRAAPSQLCPQLTSMADYNPPSQNYTTVSDWKSKKPEGMKPGEISVSMKPSFPIGKQHKKHPQIFQLFPAFLKTSNEYIINRFYKNPEWAGERSRYSDCLGAGRSGDRIPVGAIFSAPVQTGPEAQQASCTMGTGSFPGVRCVRGVTLTPNPF
jgi:hypothetical protein